MRDVNAARHIHDHLHGEHWSACVRGRIAARGNFRDINTAAREKSREPGDDAALVEAHYVDRVREHVRTGRAWLGALQVDAETVCFGEALQLGFELGESVPVA